MTKPDSKEVLCVYTAHGLEDFEIFGGTAKWKINLERAGRCRFVVCAVRAGSMPHAVGNPGAKPRTAFLIGKISKITPVKVGNPICFMGSKSETEGRSLVEMSEYASITLPDFWQKGWMTPTIYEPEEEICDLLNMSVFPDCHSGRCAKRRLTKSVCGPKHWQNTWLSRTLKGMPNGWKG